MSVILARASKGSFIDSHNVLVNGVLIGFIYKNQVNGEYYFFSDITGDQASLEVAEFPQVRGEIELRLRLNLIATGTSSLAMKTGLLYRRPD